MASVPLKFRWTGTGMEILRRFARQADEQFVIGEEYTLAEIEERSSASHRHYFALINEAWMNLPEAQAERFPSAEHLRKYALVKAGYRDERSIVCASKAEAHRVASFIKPMDEFAIVFVFEATVTVYTAKSQSVRAMGRAEFQSSKDAVITALAEMIDVTPATLNRQTEPA